MSSQPTRYAVNILQGRGDSFDMFLCVIAKLRYNITDDVERFYICFRSVSGHIVDYGESICNEITINGKPEGFYYQSYNFFDSIEYTVHSSIFSVISFLHLHYRCPCEDDPVLMDYVSRIAVLEAL